MPTSKRSAKVVFFDLLVCCPVLSAIENVEAESEHSFYLKSLLLPIYSSRRKARSVDSKN